MMWLDILVTALLQLHDVISHHKHLTGYNKFISWWNSLCYSGCKLWHSKYIFIAEISLILFLFLYLFLIYLKANAKVGRENIFQSTKGTERIHLESNINGIRLVNFPTSKNLIVKSTKSPHRNIHKYTWTSPDGITHNQIDHVLVDFW